MRKRTREMCLRLTPFEFESIEANAKRLNLSKSQYLRFLTTLPLELLDESKDGENHREVVLVDRLTLRKIEREYRRQGVNFNQGIHALNIIGKNYANPPKEKSAQEEVLKLAAHALMKLREVKSDSDQIFKEIEGIQKKVLVVEPTRNVGEGRWW